MEGEFRRHLDAGTERLDAGDAPGARESLRLAAAAMPRDLGGLGLLGQACYRAGLYEEAAEAYGRIVDDTPVEVSPRVNLGLAWMKGGRHPEAVLQFKKALDLDPGHRKAMGYLGLALLEAGDAAGARPWLERAGSPALLARCDALLAGRGTPPTGQGGPAALGASRTLVGTPDAFGVEDGFLQIAVRGEVLCRLPGLVAVRGAVDWIPENTRFRGKPTGNPFGEGTDRMARVTGQGMLLFRPGGRTYTPLDLAGEGGYFREESVFAIEEAVAFENGKLPAPPEGDLKLVQLRGHGRALLRTVAPPVMVDVSPGEPLRVAAAALVGWSGAVTPRAERMPGVPGDGLAVELLGDGLVFLDAGGANGG